MQLPMDVLGEIFKVCTTEEQFDRSGRAARCESCKPLSTGRILGQVCRQWRFTTFNTPTMWRYIHVDLKARHQTTVGKRLLPRMVEYALQRSGACTLELSFSNLGSEDALELVKELICSDGGVGTRVERLEIGLAGASFLEFLSVMQQMDKSTLKELVLYHTGYFTVHETIPEDALNTLGHIDLHTLTLVRIQWKNESLIYDNITSLTLDLGHGHEALLLRSLKSFPNISELTLQCTDHVKLIDSWEPIPEVILPSLRHITFDPRICTYSLHKLHAPNLSSITAKNFTRLSPRFLEKLPCKTSYKTLRLEAFNPVVQDCIQSISRGSYKTLEALKVEWTNKFAPGVAGFIACLRNHSEISTLELVGCSIDDEYLTSLAHDGSLLPHLISIRLHDCPNISRTMLNTIASYRRSLSSGFSAFARNIRQ